MSKLKTRDLEWYFFSGLDKKFGNKARTNRATEKGYWKTTGKDRAIYHNKKIVGMKKTLVYHSGRAPSGQRSNWVMHEYRLADIELERCGIDQDAFVLCRVFQKSGSGPKNGEQYGAPFVEEEWENDDLELVPQEETAEALNFGDDDFLTGHNLEQILQSNVSSDAAPLLSGSQSAEGSSSGEKAEFVYDNQNLIVSAGKQYLELEQLHNKISCDLSAFDNMEDKPFKHVYTCESSKSGNVDDIEFLLDEPFLDAFDNLPSPGEEGFIEANDLLNPDQTNPSAYDMLEEYLSFVDTTENSPYFTFDSAVIPGTNNGLTSDQMLLSQKESFLGPEAASLPSGELIYSNTNDTELPSNNKEFTKCQSDTFVKKASKILGAIPAPPAFAAEFPLKDAVHRLSSVVSSSSGVHANTGSGKHGNFHLIFSFGYARGYEGSASLESRVSLVSGKNDSTMFWGWFCFIFMCVLVVSMSFKLGAHICAN